MSSFLNKIFTNKQIQVVGIYNNSDKTKLCVLTIKKTKNSLIIISDNEYNSYENLFESLDQKTPCLVCIEGNGIINKKIDNNSNIDLTWKNNLNLNDIFLTSIISENYIFISLCRKDIINDYLLKFKENKIILTDIYIGSFLSVLLCEELNLDIIHSGNLNLIFQDNKLINFTKNSDTKNTINIFNKNISNFSLPLLACAIHYYTKPIDINKTYLENNSNEHLYEKAFKLLGKIIIIGFFIVLLISYILIQFYNNKNTELNIQKIYLNKTYNQIKLLEKQKNEKENLIKQSGFLSKKYVSFYNFEIAKSIAPFDIILTEVFVYPIIKDIKENEKINIENNIIIVKGYTQRENEFNDWLQIIKKQNWVSKIEIEGINNDKKNNILFNIKIIVK